MDFISPERKTSSVLGTGVQYLPGHEEKFVDFILEKFLPPTGRVLDLGGGGLRFGIPVAMKKCPITVVDLDAQALDTKVILPQVKLNSRFQVDERLIESFLEVHASDVFSFLRTCTQNFALITAFRLVHFFTPEQFDEFFSLASARLAPGGHLAFSSITSKNYADQKTANEIWLNTQPVVESRPLFRRFLANETAAKIRASQNLGEYIHMVEKSFVEKLAQAHGLTLVAAELESTRIVDGYVLKKSD